VLLLRSRSARLGVRLSGLFFAGAWLLAAPAAWAQGDCHVSVQPTSGTVGTVFVVSGSGFGESTVLTILRNGSVVSEEEPELEAETGSFTVRVTADAAGTWEARAVLPESECAGKASFTVLPDSATGAVGELSTPGAPLGALLAAAVGGFAIGILRSGRMRRR
jgi:hypothetical protein